MNNWSFGTRIYRTKGANDASPHTSYLFEFLKNNPGDKGPGKDSQV